MALRLGQDAVLSGHEASPYSVAFLHNLVWKTPRANAYGRVSLGPARHSASVACSIIWPSLQPRPAHRASALCPWDTRGHADSTGSQVLVHVASLGHILGTQLNQAPGP